MSRPLLLSLTPEVLRGKLWYRLYRGKAGYDDLFVRAPLSYANGWAMHNLVESDYISQCVAFLGFFELSLSRQFYQKASERGGRLIDVGANMGYFSLLWLAGKADNEVFAFEPNTRNLQLLNTNLDENACAHRCHVHPVGCSDRSGKVQFDAGPGAQTGWGSLAVADSERATQIDVVRIDEVIADDVPIELMKIDTEGADPLVLRGSERLLRRKQIREIVFEMNLPGMSYLGLNQRDLIEFLTEMGYSSACIEGAGRPVSTWRSVPDEG